MSINKLKDGEVNECGFEPSRSDVNIKIEKETAERLEIMKKNVVDNKDKVINDLLGRVIGDVKPELHRNLRLG